MPTARGRIGAVCLWFVPPAQATEVEIDDLMVTGPVTATRNGATIKAVHAGQIKGSGQPIDFVATDLLKLRDGTITDNWHIEDIPTLLQKMGMKASP